MTTILGDLRYALRRARRRVGFTLIAVLSLGLGIGVNTAAFSLVNAIMLRKTPLPHPERVAELFVLHDAQVFAPMSYADYKDLREQSRSVFSQISVSNFGVVPRDMGDHVESVTAEMVNGDYFPLIGLRPVIGRLLGPDDDIAKGMHPVAVLSYGYWQRVFAGDPGIVGKQVHLSGRAYTIVGVAPKEIEGLLPGLPPSLYLPIQMTNQLEPTTTDQLADRGNHSEFIKVRLAPGQTFAAARVVIDRFVRDMQQRYPDEWSAHTHLQLYPVTQVAVSPLLDNIAVPAAWALMVVVALVLVVACANLASFLLAQARDRQREIAIRLAIGASRRALVRQLLVESLLLAVTGGVVGAVLSNVALGAFLHSNLPLPLPINLDVRPDARVLAFVIAASVAAGILFGLLPALQATRPGVIDTIKNENAGARPGRRFTMRSGLVVAQTATSLLLLVTAVLFLRSFAAQAHVDPGFGSRPAAVVWMSLPSDRYDAARRAQVMADIERRVRSLPDIDGVGVVESLMLNPLSSSQLLINVDGFVPPKGEKGFTVDDSPADSGFFDAAGIKLIEGRLFTSADQPSTQRVAVINQVMANMFWPGRDPIGRTFRDDTTVVRVIGVVKNTKVRSLGEPPRPFIFRSFSQTPSPFFMLVARTRGDAARAGQQTVAALHELDPDLMIIQAKTMEQHLATVVLPARLGAVAFALFAGLALVLAMIGIYGVVRYAVARRSREVAIRLAVGARPDSVVRLLMREGVTLVGTGAIIGLVVAALVSRGLEQLLYGVPSIDPVAFVGAPLLLLAVGALAAFLPARRASRVDPAVTLRAE